MCWVENCCNVVKLNLGCLIIGTVTFVLSSLLATASIIIPFLDVAPNPALSQNIAHHLLTALHLDNLNKSSTELISVMILIVSLLWMVSALMLFYGVKKNKPGFVLCYFSYGIFLVFLAMLSALLLIIKGCWVLTLFIWIAVMIYIYCLVVVHSFYEMQTNDKYLSAEFDDDAQLISDINV